MLNDRTTLKDLSFFSTDGNGIFELLDHTETQEGRDVLRRLIHEPPGSFEALKETQDTVRFWADNLAEWTTLISNGTLVMLQKFFESADNASSPPQGISFLLGSFLQKLFNRNEYFFTQFSVSHIRDFLRGCAALTELLRRADLPALLNRELTAMQEELQHRLTQDVIKTDKHTSYRDIAHLSYRVRREMKHAIYRLIMHYARLDAWHSMAKATVLHNWTFPELVLPGQVCFEVTDLHHPLLREAVAYSASFSQERNFLILTGANMSGKTTFMRAAGVGALLAHLGMGVPAAAMRISFLQGIITNMHVEDNLLRGESYFMAEVRRMRHTAERLTQNGANLVLMDELFKGTNVHDAYECTRAVVEGLLHHPGHIMILSTHLYEVAQHFREHRDLQFAYFVTEMAADGSYRFTYRLKPGISNDRIGYRILQKEGVLDLLRKSKD